MVRLVRTLIISVLGGLVLFASLHSIEHASSESHQHSAHPCLLRTLAKAQAETPTSDPVFLAWRPGIALPAVFFTAEFSLCVLSGLPLGRAPPA